ncbi:DUF1499 domain-containing protein [Roseovarius aestuarii]|uniref:DUF1499 domain-containing protein n=2 Tax=Roseovarius aestuarii TaxID=475083 RepID=A0A1X7BS05_9RHOB|nr:DUF1499 domain-containing protein [Roseovarius aestuarii]SMC12392.1 hypothetical protein ROA7745_02217 [Roseovarius aestuarii]
MKWIGVSAAVLPLLVLALATYVRIAPTNVERWHRMPADLQVADLDNGAVRIIEAGTDDLVRLDTIIRGTARTQVLAGSVEAGMITYVTRSAAIGFPDYTTIRLRDGQIEIFGRARYGASDLGVNAARIDGWLDALAQRG